MLWEHGDSDSSLTLARIRAPILVNFSPPSLPPTCAIKNICDLWGKVKISTLTGVWKELGRKNVNFR